MAEAQVRPQPPASNAKPQRKKLPKLPSSAKVTKRPLLRPAIPSPYTGASQQKIVYISAKTPFLSAVKRVEKLLHLAGKRLVQSATTNAQQSKQGRGYGKRKRDDGDEILGIAEEVERLKGGKRRKMGDEGAVEQGKGEEVVMKGTGKAIHRVLELALWFQQREEEYVVRMKTGSVGVIDDIELNEDGADPAGKGRVGDSGEDAEAGAEKVDVMDVDDDNDGKEQQEGVSLVEQGNEVDAAQGKGAKKRKRERGTAALADDEVPETRIRCASVLEAAVSLR